MVRRLLTTLCTLILTVCANAQGNGGPPSLADVVRHQVDYQDNMTTTDSDWAPANAPAIEFLEGSHVVNYIVYKKGDTIHGVTKFKNYNNFAVTYAATPEGSPRLVSPAANAVVEATNGAIKEEVTGLTYNITSGSSGTLAANGGIASISWTVSGVPDYLCAGRMSLPVKLILHDLDQEFTWHNHEDLAGVYLSRMVTAPVDTMSIPWGDFAYHVGLWGWGATSQAQAHSFLVYGIHYSERHFYRRNVYDPEGEFRFYQLAAQEFRMKELLTNISVGNLYMDCQDFSGMLGYALECNGLNVSLGRIRPNSNEDFETTSVCRAGYDSTSLSNYENMWFSFHLTINLSDAASDAALSYRYNLSGGTHLNPVVAWAMPGYWQGASLGLGVCNYPYPSTHTATLWTTNWEISNLV